MNRPLKRILYVEDEPDIRTIAVTVLESLGGFSVIACSSGREAIEAAPSAAPDLLLLDVMMPGMDGPTTLAALRALPQTAQTPAVFMTAKVQASEIAQFKSLGAFEVIPKPFDPMTLASQLTDIWARCAGSAQPAAKAPAPADSLRDGLAKLYGEYAADLPSIIANIESLGTIFASTGEVETLKALHQALHTLAGTAGTFGYTELGKAARSLELSIAPHLPDAKVPASIIASFAGVFETMRRAAVAPDKS